jgi:hypothetical protein
MKNTLFKYVDNGKTKEIAVSDNFLTIDGININLKNGQYYLNGNGVNIANYAGPVSQANYPGVVGTVASVDYASYAGSISGTANQANYANKIDLVDNANYAGYANITVGYAAYALSLAAGGTADQANYANKADLVSSANYAGYAGFASYAGTAGAAGDAIAVGLSAGYANMAGYTPVAGSVKIGATVYTEKTLNINIPVAKFTTDTRGQYLSSYDVYTYSFKSLVPSTYTGGFANKTDELTPVTTTIGPQKYLTEVGMGNVNLSAQ